MDTFNERSLWAAVLQLAIEDWDKCKKIKKSNKPSKQDRQFYRNHSGELREFFKSSWFRQVCSFVDIEPEALLKALGIRGKGIKEV